jgi:hypothetical protein
LGEQVTICPPNASDDDPEDGMPFVKEAEGLVTDRDYEASNRALETIALLPMFTGSRENR